jgi:hypothetical protein
LLGAGVILVVFIVLLVVGGDDGAVTNVAEPQLAAVPKEAVVAAAPSAALAPSPSLLRDALAGSPEAIAELEQRPISQRSTEEWLALAQGRATLERYSGAIEAYQEAILREPSVASNPELAHNVWLAAGRAEVAEQALRFAARHLGSNGADLLYKVWVDLSKAVTPTTALAKELLQSPSVQKVATPALKVAVELRSAEDCETRAELLPRVMLYGDARAGRVLRRLQTRSHPGQAERPARTPLLSGVSRTTRVGARTRPEHAVSLSNGVVEGMPCPYENRFCATALCYSSSRNLPHGSDVSSSNLSGYPPRISRLLQRSRACRDSKRSTGARQRSDVDVHQRWHGSIQELVHGSGATRLQAGHDQPKVHAYRRQAQRLRKCGPVPASPHLLRDAR